MQAYKIYDSHCHIYPDGISHRAIRSIDRFYDGLPAKPQDGTVKTLLEGGRSCGISHFVVCAVATKPEQVSHINRFIADQVRASGGAFTGLGTMHPDAEDLRADLEELVSLGLKGVKLHPDIQQFHADDPRAMKIYEMLEDGGLPVCVHTGDHRYDYSNPGRIARVLRTFPSLKMIGAHLGGWSVWDEAVSLLPDFPNLTVDTSSSFFWLKKERAKEIIRAYGSERVMFGTDYPMWKQQEDISYLRELDLTDREYEDIFRRTCGNLFHIDEQGSEFISN